MKLRVLVVAGVLIVVGATASLAEVNCKFVLKNLSLPGRTVQLPSLPGRRGYAGKKVEVCQQPNGDLRIYLDRRLLHVEPARADAAPVRAQQRRRPSPPRKKKPIRIYTYGGRSARAVRF